MLEAEAGDFLFAGGEVGRCLRGVGDDAPGEGGDKDGGEALDEEE